MLPFVGRNHVPKIVNGEGLTEARVDLIISVEQEYCDSNRPLLAIKIELIENTDDYIMYRVYYFPFGSIERRYAREPDGNWIFNLERLLL